MKKTLFALSLALCGSAANAQNSAVFKAQTAEQKGDIAGAITILEGALQNPKTTKFAQIYNMAGEDHAKLFNGELTKAASGMPFDTLAFTTHLDKMIECYTKSHEADVKPDEKGRVKSQYVMANHFRMLSFVDYYNYAAMFKYQQGDTIAAIDYFEKYINFPKNVVFSQHETDSIYAAKKNAYAQTRLNIAALNFSKKNWQKAITYADQALADTIGTRDLLVIKMQSAAAMGDSALWLNTLTEAVSRTEDESFMQNLLYYYVTHNDLTGAEQMANNLIATAPEKKGTWYMKGCVELNMKKDYVAAREDFEKALAIDPDFVNANVNMGATYINQIYKDKIDGKFKYVGSGKGILPAQKAAYEKELATVKSYYESAKPYMEKARELAPDQPRLWAYSLQMIYENLQMKDKKAEIDEIIKGL